MDSGAPRPAPPRDGEGGPCEARWRGPERLTAIEDQEAGVQEMSEKFREKGGETYPPAAE